MYGRVYLRLMLYIQYVYAAQLRIIIKERRGGQYSVTNCQHDVGLSVRCFCPQSSKIDVSAFEDR